MIKLNMEPINNFYFAHYPVVFTKFNSLPYMLAITSFIKKKKQLISYKKRKKKKTILFIIFVYPTCTTLSLSYEQQCQWEALNIYGIFIKHSCHRPKIRVDIFFLAE